MGALLSIINLVGSVMVPLRSVMVRLGRSWCAFGSVMGAVSVMGSREGRYSLLTQAKTCTSEESFVATVLQ